MERHTILQLRNRIAKGGSVADDEIRTLVESMQAVVGKKEQASASEIDRLVLGVQFLANASVGCFKRSLCWDLIYPELILELSLSRNPDILEPLCYALWNFAEGNPFMQSGTGTAILNNLVEFYGNTCTNSPGTSFSLFLARVIEQDEAMALYSLFLLRSIAKVEIECLGKDVCSSVCRRLLKAAQQDDSHEILLALRNCVLSVSVPEQLLVETACWAVDRLRALSCQSGVRAGCKTDIIALLANLVWQRTEIQHVVLDQKALGLVLNSVRLDDQNPVAREWSLLFIRNMCIDNQQAQEFIKNLKPKEVVLDGGGEIQYDEKSGKFKFKRG